MIDLKETGKFIAECRKEKQLTQKQLGDRMNVTDRAVSKWETGRAFPDVSILENLCEELGISVSELLAGKRIEPERCREEAERMLVDTISEAQLYRFQIILYVLGAVEIIMIYLPFLRKDGFLPQIDLVNTLCWLVTLCILGCGIYLNKMMPGKVFRTANPLLEGAAGACYFILIVVLNFIVSGGVEAMNNGTALFEKIAVGFTAAAGLAFVVAVKILQAKWKRDRQTNEST